MLVARKLASLVREASALRGKLQANSISIISTSRLSTTSSVEVVAMTSSLEASKKLAAQKAVNEHVATGMRLGIGSGSTIVFAVEHLAKRVADESLTVTCVPTSFQARQLIRKHGLPLSDLEHTPELDVAIDGADEVDLEGNCIKGGGGCQTQEKVVASAAEKLVIIADDSKKSTSFGDKWKKGIPIEVIPMAYKPVMIKLEGLGLQPLLRMAKSKAGPVVTDNSNFIIDATFSEVSDWPKLNSDIISIPGVVETGLFLGMADVVIFGSDSGVEEISFADRL